MVYPPKTVTHPSSNRARRIDTPNDVTASPRHHLRTSTRPIADGPRDMLSHLVNCCTTVRKIAFEKACNIQGEVTSQESMISMSWGNTSCCVKFDSGEDSSLYSNIYSSLFTLMVETIQQYNRKYKKRKKKKKTP